MVLRLACVGVRAFCSFVEQSALEAFALEASIFGIQIKGFLPAAARVPYAGECGHE
jgi:hypothetical protein